MKFYKKRVAGFLGGKGFYYVMGCCLVAMALAAYSAIDAGLFVKQNATENEHSSIKEPLPEADFSPINEDTNSSYEPEPNLPLPGVDSQEPSEIGAASGETQATMFILPVAGKVSKEFSEERLQYSATMGDMRLHLGVDVEADAGSEVKAANVGTVAAIDKDTALGTVVSVDHGGIIIRYCGIGEVAVTAGQTVQSGQPIGSLGEVTAECADNPHLHLEAIRDGKAISFLELLN